MKKFAKHLPHYFTLFGLLIAGLVGFSVFKYDHGFQTAIAVGLSFGYFAWGVIHHLMHKDLYLVVVIEYLSVSVLGLVILLSLIYRS